MKGNEEKNEEEEGEEEEIKKLSKKNDGITYVGLALIITDSLPHCLHDVSSQSLCVVKERGER